jgi:hypothetical protein
VKKFSHTRTFLSTLEAPAFNLGNNVFSLLVFLCWFTASSTYGQTTFRAFFNNGTGSSGDKNASAYQWAAAVGSSAIIDQTLSGAPAQMGISQGTTTSVGVPFVSGQSTSAGFFFALPDAAPVAQLLYTTNVTTSDSFQDAPQTNWFRSGSEVLLGLTIDQISQFSVYTRPATSVTSMRFAVRIGTLWHVSATTYSQSNVNVFEHKTMTGLTQPGAWYTAGDGVTLDTDLSDNSPITLAGSEVISGYGIYAHTGTQSGTNARVRIDSFEILCAPETPPASGNAIVTFAGNAGTEEFKDVMELSDGTVLVTGSAENLNWINAPKTLLPPLTIPFRNTGRTAFIMRCSADLSTLLGVWHLPAGQSHDFRWIKGTHKPGAATGELYLSGSCDATSGDYFIARLSENFLTAAPTGFDWVKVAKSTSAHGDNAGLQTWDVGGDGRVVYVDETGETIRVFFLNAAGQALKLPALRGSHWPNAVVLNDSNRQEGIGADLPATEISGISFPADLRSWTETDRLAIMTDGNGQMKRGKWPLDLFFPVRDRIGSTTGTIEYGYTGYKSAGRHRIGGIAVDRESNAFSIGFNIQSRFWDAPANKEQPDFEPAVISYTADGALKWWSRLYHEVIDSNQNSLVDAGETRLSSPDQYVDGLSMDYSATPHRVVVLARCHGNNDENLWGGNTVAASPGAQAFQNRFTGTEGNIHISWVGKFREDNGNLLHCSYLSGYLRNVSLTQDAYGDSNLDGWPSHNSGWPSLTSTFAEPGGIKVDGGGYVHVIGRGPRMVTTTHAWQKLPKITPSVQEGISPWNQFARVYAPTLNTLRYSTALTGEWTYPQSGAQPVGADNTDLYGIFPLSDGLIVVGRQRNAGNAVPTMNVPAWGATTPSGVSALLAKFPYVGGGSAPSTLPTVSQMPTANPATVAGNSTLLNVLASDPVTPENSLIYTWSVSTGPAGGVVQFTPNASNEAKQCTAVFTRAGSYTLTVTVTNLSGKTISAVTAVTVSAVASGLEVTPSIASVPAFATQLFEAVLRDQFSQPITGQSVLWSSSGGGNVETNGEFTAASELGGPHSVSASIGTFTATAQVTVLESNAPSILLPRSTVSQSAQVGTSISRPFHLQNQGANPLTWTASAVMPNAGLDITAFQTSAESGGPTYEWIDISSDAMNVFTPTGNDIFDDSNVALTFPSGFTFPFFGAVHNSVRICSNAFITFSASTSLVYNNRSLPTLTDTPGNMVAVAWHDWVVDSSAWVKAKLVDPQTLVITWNNVRRFNPDTQRATFQCILKSSGEIITQIKSFQPTDRKYTLGVQNLTATKSVQASFNPSTHFIPTGASSNFAVRFSLAAALPTWLTITPASGSLPANNGGEIELTFDASSLTVGNYTAFLGIASNDPYQPSLSIPVSFSVGTSVVPPNAPSALTATPSDAGEVTLQWIREGGGVTQHRAEYRIVGDSAWLMGPVFSAAASSGVVTGLEPSISYEFRIIAMKLLFASLPSNVAQARIWSHAEAWRDQYFGSIENTGNANDLQDPDQDGIVNILEYALAASHPREPSNAALPTVSMTPIGDSLYTTLTVMKNQNSTDILYVVESSGDLQDWNAGSGHTVIIEETAQILIARDVIPSSSTSARFLRLKVTRNPMM